MKRNAAGEFLEAAITKGMAHPNIVSAMAHSTAAANAQALPTTLRRNSAPLLDLEVHLSSDTTTR